MFILPIIPISLNLTDDGVAVGTNKPAKPEGPEKESEEPKVSGFSSKSINSNKLY